MDYGMWEDIESKLKCGIPYWQIIAYTGVPERDIKMIEMHMEAKKDE